jgi:hypothetical protein
MGLGKLNREAVRQVHVVASDSRLDVETVSIVTYAFSASVRIDRRAENMVASAAGRISRHAPGYF